jgi:hypothetical protein
VCVTHGRLCVPNMRREKKERKLLRLCVWKKGFARLVFLPSFVQRRRWRRQPGVSHFHRLLCNIIFKTHRQPPPPPPKNPTAIYTLGRASNHARCCQLPFGRSVFVFFFFLFGVFGKEPRGSPFFVVFPVWWPSPFAPLAHTLWWLFIS